MRILCVHGIGTFGEFSAYSSLEGISALTFSGKPGAIRRDFAGVEPGCCEATLPPTLHSNVWTQLLLRIVRRILAREAELLALVGPAGRQGCEQMFDLEVFGLPTIEGGFSYVRRQIREWENLAYVSAMY
jgi:hypothetical protein